MADVVDEFRGQGAGTLQGVGQRYESFDLFAHLVVRDAYDGDVVHGGV